jgi:hypothetical protein
LLPVDLPVQSPASLRSALSAA